MARDNGTRGSYRYVSSSLSEEYCLHDDDDASPVLPERIALPKSSDTSYDSDSRQCPDFLDGFVNAPEHDSAPDYCETPELPGPSASPDDPSPSPRKTFTNVRREKIDGIHNTSVLFDHPPELVNLRFPPIGNNHANGVPNPRLLIPGDRNRPRESMATYLGMSIPGALANCSPAPKRRHGLSEVTWMDLAICNLTVGVTVVCFLVVLYDGLSSVGGFLWGIFWGILGY